MCTAVVDVQVNTRVVELEEDVTKYHSHVQVTMEDGTVRGCWGGLLKVETITAKASYDTSLYNSKNSTYQIFMLKDVLKN